MQNQTKELTEKQPLTPELAREFDALVPLMRRLYDVLKPHSWEKKGYVNVSLEIRGFDNPTIQFLFFADGGVLSDSIPDLFEKVKSFDPEKKKRAKLASLKAELATLETELAEVV